MKRIGKTVLPIVARPFASEFVNKIVNAVELGSCLIQGKGSGSGWDINAEVSVAGSFIKTQTPVLFDVGANVGDWCTRMLKLFPRCSKLAIVEPQPKCLEVLALIDFQDKALFPCALADKPGEMTLFTAEQKESWDGASFFQRLDTVYSGVRQHQVTVRTRTLDDILEELGNPSVDFMKMDIEGAELLALQGAVQSLRRGRIKALSFEFGSGDINSRAFFRDFWNLLTSFGYNIFRILPGGGSLRIREYHESLECFYRVTNYVAALEDATGDRST